MTRRRARILALVLAVLTTAVLYLTLGRAPSGTLPAAVWSVISFAGWFWIGRWSAGWWRERCPVCDQAKPDGDDR